MSYDKDTIDKARKLRQAGISLGQISKRFNISKSTASLWTAREVLSRTGKKRIKDRQDKARQRAFNTISRNREIVRKEIRSRAKVIVKNAKLDPYLHRILLSFLVWAEGDKELSCLGFSNSDPKMINTFLYLLRHSFHLDETKLRGLVHLHEYHNEKKVLDFWSKTTNIPLDQFTKSYLKPHTGKRIKKGYMGSMHIKYFDFQVARELAYIYNMFADKLRGVG